MRTKCDSSKPKEKDDVWMVTGNMTDENKNSFHISVTTPISPKANRLDLMNFMKLQSDDGHKKINIIFVDSNPSDGNNDQPREIQLINLYIRIAPIQLTSPTPYILEVSDSMGDDRAAQGSTFPYTVINSKKLFVSCSVDTGRVKMTAAGESKTLNEGETDQISRSGTTRVSWDILFECLGPQNFFTMTLTDHGTKRES